MTAVKKITLISGSPKVGEPSVSDWLAGRAASLLACETLAVSQVNVRDSLAGKRTEEDFSAMLSSDALVLIFPLYIFCLPGILIRYLQDFYAYYAQRREQSRITKVFCAVNCGFPEPGINSEAVRVVRSFSGKINAEFRFGLMIGGGGMLVGAADAPFMRKTLSAVDGAFLQMKTDLLTGDVSKAADIEARVGFPRRLYFIGGNRGWISMAKKYKISRKELRAKPYV